MEKGDILIIKDTHEVFTYFGQFDDNNAIVQDKRGETYILKNEWLQKDYERTFIKHITHKIATLWNKLKLQKPCA